MNRPKQRFNAPPPRPRPNIERPREEKYKFQPVVDWIMVVAFVLVVGYLLIQVTAGLAELVDHKNACLAAGYHDYSSGHCIRYEGQTWTPLEDLEQ